jgi:hypothetical protein
VAVDADREDRRHRRQIPESARVLEAWRLSQELWRHPRRRARAVAQKNVTDLRRQLRALDTRIANLTETIEQGGGHPAVHHSVAV